MQAKLFNLCKSGKTGRYFKSYNGNGETEIVKAATGEIYKAILKSGCFGSVTAEKVTSEKYVIEFKPVSGMLCGARCVLVFGN